LNLILVFILSLVRARACDMATEPQQWRGEALELPLEVRAAAEAVFATETGSVLSADTASELVAPDFGHSLIGESEPPSAPDTPRDVAVAVAASGALHPDARAALSRWREKEAQDRTASQKIFQNMTWKEHVDRQAKEAEEWDMNVIRARRVKLEDAARNNNFDVLLKDIFERKLKEITARDAMKTDLETTLATLRRVDAVMESDAPEFAKNLEKQSAQWMCDKRDRLLLGIAKCNASIEALTTEYYAMQIRAKEEDDKATGTGAASSAGPGMALPVDVPMEQASPLILPTPVAAGTASSVAATEGQPGELVGAQDQGPKLEEFLEIKRQDDALRRF